MDKKQEMKRLRNAIRKHTKAINASLAESKYLAPVVGCFKIEMVKWDPASHSVLIHIYNPRVPRSEWNWNNDTDHYEWLYTYDWQVKRLGWTLFEPVNRIVLAERQRLNI